MGIQLADINFRDPFIVPEPDQGLYYLFGTEGQYVWKGRPRGFWTYTSRDLQEWEPGGLVFDAGRDFWAELNYWAPEVHEYDGRWYLIATFKAEGISRGTQILAASSPAGPFHPHSAGPVTPREWECLDGTLWVEDGRPWMVFCHEWGQVRDGEVCLLPLNKDLSNSAGEPELLFKASSHPAARGLLDGGKSGFVTDGPFLHRMSDGSLIMLWSTLGEGQSYLQCQARSAGGSIKGPWEQIAEPIFTGDGGHGMLFRTFDGALKLTLHRPNSTPDERPLILDAEERGGIIALSRQ